jgi:Flp pilus assembly protein TadG
MNLTEVRHTMNRDPQAGQSLVEFALVLPLLLILLLGIIEFGLLLYDQAVITNAAREGARAGIVAPNFLKSLSDIKDNVVTPVVSNYCRNHLISFSSGTPSVSVVSTGVQDKTLTITVTYNYGWLVFPKFLSLANPFPLSATSQMRFEL